MNEENKIPQQRSVEEQLEDLRQQLDWRKEEERKELRKIKAEAFRMAIQIKPNGSFSSSIGQTVEPKYSTDDLIKSGNKIYEELIR